MTNPMAMKGPYRAFFPVGPHTKYESICRRHETNKGMLLVAEANIDLSRSGSVLHLSDAFHPRSQGIVAIDL